MIIKYKLDKGCYAPTKAHKSDAGIDLRTPEEKYIGVGGNATVNTGVHVEIPEGYCGLLVSKSGLNVYHGMTTTGLIDSGYSGSIVVKIYNRSDENYVFHKGEKITQLVILPIPEVELEEASEIESGERGNNGFGSSGRQ